MIKKAKPEKNDAIDPVEAQPIKPIELDDSEENGDQKVVVINPNIPKSRKKEARDLAVKISKILLMFIIVAFLMSLFVPWFTLSGKSAELGMIGFSKTVGESGAVIEVSPMSLINYAIQYQSIYKTSIVSTMHLGVIYTFIVTIIIGFSSCIILAAMKGLRGMQFVKVASILSILFCCFNFLVIKMPFMNMFVIHAKGILKSANPLNAVNITSRGIAQDNVFYPYEMSFTKPFLVALCLLGGWLFLSAVLLEIKRKRDEDLREIEIKTKLKN